MADGPSIAQLMALDSKSLRANMAKAAENAQAFAAVPVPLRKYAAESVAGTLASAFDIPVLDVFAAAWRLRRDLKRYCDKDRYPPAQRIDHVLSEHTIEADYPRAIDIEIDKVAIKPPLAFDLKLGFTFQSAVLEIRDARIVAARPGACHAEGKLSFAGYTLAERKTGDFALPGRLDFGEGIAIPPPSGMETG